ncbi:MAG: response regulator transcription factor [Thiobacillaceae bacterium]
MNATDMTSRKLLIVEDDRVFSTVLARAMNKRGFEVAEASGLEQAREITETFAAQYAIVDLKLPGESGLKVVEYLTRLPMPPRIVVLTGYASIATAVEAMRLGAIHYLAKPADADEILAALQRDEADTNVELNPSTLSVGRLEWEHIHKVLAENEGNISAAARALKMHRRTLQRKLEKRPPSEES